MPKQRIKIRAVWEINPRTRIKASKKGYDRNALKRELDERLYEEENYDDES